MDTDNKTGFFYFSNLQRVFFSTVAPLTLFFPNEISPMSFMIINMMVLEGAIWDLEYNMGMYEAKTTVEDLGPNVVHPMSTFYPATILELLCDQTSTSSVSFQVKFFFLKRNVMLRYPVPPIHVTVFILGIQWRVCFLVLEDSYS